MKEIKRKDVYLFNIIMGGICVLLLGISMLINKLFILKVLFVIAMVSYVGLLICFFIDKKRRM